MTSETVTNLRVVSVICPVGKFQMIDKFSLFDNRVYVNYPLYLCNVLKQLTLYLILSQSGLQTPINLSVIFCINICIGQAPDGLASGKSLGYFRSGVMWCCLEQSGASGYCSSI